MNRCVPKDSSERRQFEQKRRLVRIERLANVAENSAKALDITSCESIGAETRENVLKSTPGRQRLEDRTSFEFDVA